MNEPNENIVITPGGPRQQSQVIEVAPGSAVQRTETGAHIVVPAPAPGMVVTPGGFRNIAMIHTVEPGHLLDGTAGTIKKVHRATGNVVQDFGAIPPRDPTKILMPANVHVPAGVAPALGSGWITYASWTNNTQRHINLFKTTWVVPPPPATQSGQTIFLFNGIQNSTMIYQPVLQWGPSADGGGNYWAVASWYVDGQNGIAFKTPLVRVNAGDTLTGVMTLTAQSANGFSYNCEFQGIANTSLPIQNIQELYWCIETLEAYTISKCTDYPQTCKTAFTGIEIQTGGQQAPLQWTPTTPVNDCGQHAVVVSNSSPGGEVDLYYTSSAIFYNKNILGDTSPRSPSLASLNGALYIAWKGDGNDNLNVMFSTDGGRSFGHKYTSPETSPLAPAICVHNGNLYIAWKGDGNDNLNVAQVALSGVTPVGFINKVTLGDTSPFSPTLASLNGRLYIGWRGDGNSNLNVMYSTDNGRTFGNKYTSPETSAQAPALCSHNSTLFIAWKGDGNNNLNVAQVIISGTHITGFSKVTLADTSPVSPSIVSHNGRLYISWKGDGNDNLNVMFSNDNGRTFGNKYTSFETSPQAPCVADSQGTLFISWKGDGNDNLNVAAVCN